MFNVFLQLLALAVSISFLGAALLLALIVAIARRHNHLDRGESFLGNFFWLSALSVSIAFFSLAMTTPG